MDPKKTGSGHGWQYASGCLDTANAGIPTHASPSVRTADALMSRPLRVIVAYPPGGASDTPIRINGPWGGRDDRKAGADRQPSRCVRHAWHRTGRAIHA